MGEQLSDLGEFAVIGRLLERVPVAGPGVLIGPGDDAAAVRPDGDAVLATTDMLLEGRHFDLGLSSPSDVGFKALAVNLSDIAAMGGVPRWATISIGAPPETPVALLEGIYDGIGEAARAAGVVILGGDTVGGDTVVVGVALLGEPGPAGIVTRSGARSGDALCVTGSLGAAAAGLALLRAAPHDPAAARLLSDLPALAAAHRRPVARLREGRVAAEAGAHAMIDVSDGFAQDVGHLCEASGVGVELRGPLPAAPGVAEVEIWAGAEHRFALTGGDDYELAIAVPDTLVEQLRAAIAPTPLSVVGRFGGHTVPEGPGWDGYR